MWTCVHKSPNTLHELTTCRHPCRQTTPPNNRTSRTTMRCNRSRSRDPVIVLLSTVSPQRQENHLPQQRADSDTTSSEMPLPTRHTAQEASGEESESSFLSRLARAVRTLEGGEYLYDRENAAAYLAKKDPYYPLQPPIISHYPPSRHQVPSSPDKSRERGSESQQQYQPRQQFGSTTTPCTRKRTQNERTMQQVSPVGRFDRPMSSPVFGRRHTYAFPFTIKVA